MIINIHFLFKLAKISEIKIVRLVFNNLVFFIYKLVFYFVCCSQTYHQIISQRHFPNGPCLCHTWCNAWCHACSILCAMPTIRSLAQLFKGKSSVLPSQFSGGFIIIIFDFTQEKMAFIDYFSLCKYRTKNA